MCEQFEPQAGFVWKILDSITAIICWYLVLAWLYTTCPEDRCWPSLRHSHDPSPPACAAPRFLPV